ncbi:hypothetical protein A33Q_3885 [Indibacter alkaliphilus LW1]|uniref:Uncharacterized protein n=1 Tax=Indibacter alkaliphilus (strain CCUG 57479 / KCTC 22604 / LW1) TaxID=1189612 RepID=S2D7X5_INDAL|nr:hypothetical protein A33Q_3885 [Indibacter alkaliphilus LW1]
MNLALGRQEENRQTAPIIHLNFKSAEKKFRLKGYVNPS